MKFKKSVLTVLFALAICGNLRSAEYLKLKNGTNVVFDNDPSSLLAAVQIWISAGSVDEDSDIAGISHYIEHTIFKGTKNRQQKEIAPEIERFGGTINAATSKDFTFFYAILPSSYCLKALEILTDVVLNPEFPKKELEKERKVVLEEIKRGDDNPQTELFDNFYSLVYSPSKYATRVIGTAKTVSKIKREDMLAFHDKHYIPRNITVVITGNFEREDTLNFIKSTYGNLPKTKTAKKPKTENPIRESTKKIIKKDVAHAYILIGFDSADINSPDQYPLDLAAYVLSGGRASRLHKKYVEDTKLAYGISSSFSTNRGPGLFYVYAQCDPKNGSELSGKIMLELAELSVKTVSDEELNRAKALLTRDKLLSNQTPDGKAEELGFYAALGNTKISENYIKRINAVKPQDIKKVFSKYLNFPNVPTVIMLPEKS